MTKNHQKHNNQVRIIGGIHRGRKIFFPSTSGLRPTADSVRERLFNWLGQDLTGSIVLDLFAGSGVMGFEAASRCAQQVVMVEINAQVVTTLKKNMSQLQLSQSKIVCADALNFLGTTDQQFDVVFLDPPYGWTQWELLLTQLPQHLQPQARVYLESNDCPTLPAGWTILKQGKSGKSHFTLLTYNWQ
jgi:16S rRNA (guanine966-N2)-methyltransferase